MTLVNVIYLATRADVDPDESDFDSEFATSLLGTYNGTLDLLTLNVADGGDGAAGGNDTGATPDSMTYTRDGVFKSAFTDSSHEFMATIMRGDGTTYSARVVVFQLSNGEVFLTEHWNDGALDGMNIQQIQLTSLVKNDSNGWLTNQTISGGQIVCFAEGTLIETADGPRPVEALFAGDKLVLLDGSSKPLVWIGAQRVPAIDRFAPVRISEGALGKGVPNRTLYVSPQHRILISSPVVARMTTAAHALVPAIKLVGLPGIDRAMGGFVRYFHLLLDRHEILIANGAPAESLFLGDEAVKALPADQLAEIAAVRADFQDSEGCEPAATLLSGRRANKLRERHLKNGLSLFPDAA